MIPYGRQDISPEDIDAVTEVQRSNWLAQGQAGPRFELVMAAIATATAQSRFSNATAALHFACKTLDPGPGADC
jgi:dTDP-4-amino-4,6-dideoxygalactose transaminase